MARNEETDSKGPDQTGPPTSRGWTAMDKTVRELDEARIKDCKEDIDTVLVFAGLFSAVMTAFIIESYKTLNEDPADVSVRLLMQISMQLNSFAINVNGGTGLINSTLSSSSPTSFTALKSSIHINVLWFTSLILTLITASLGMLVKTWLREYLASGDTGTSPFTRLRIRFFRYLGLKKWKVFEIAALLPLLLQVALGLFLLGLCLFAMSINDAVGIASITIIAVWAFLIISSIIMPVVAGHCPYKTPLTGHLLGWIRKKVIYKKPPISPTVSYYGIDTGDDKTEDQKSQKKQPLTYGSYIYMSHEEETMAQTSKLDYDIIIGVDSIQADDQLIFSAIVESFWQTQPSQPSYEQAIPFVFHFLQSRHLISDEYQQDTIQLLSLKTTSQVWLPMASLIVDALAREISKEQQGYSGLTVFWDNWMLQGVALIVCNANIALPTPQWSELLSLCSTWSFEKLIEKLPQTIFYNGNKKPKENVLATFWTDHNPLTAQDMVQRLDILLRSTYKSELPDKYEKFSTATILHTVKNNLGYKLCKTIGDTLCVKVGKEGDLWARSVICGLIWYTSKSTNNTIVEQKWLLEAEVAEQALHCIFFDMVYGYGQSTDCFSRTYQQASENERVILRGHISKSMQDFIDNPPNLSWAYNNALNMVIYLRETLFDKKQMEDFSSIDLEDPPALPEHWSNVWSAMATIIKRSLETAVTEAKKDRAIDDIFWLSSVLLNNPPITTSAATTALSPLALPWIRYAFPEPSRVLVDAARQPEWRSNLDDRFRDSRWYPAVAEFLHVAEQEPAFQIHDIETEIVAAGAELPSTADNVDSHSTIETDSFDARSGSISVSD